MNLSVIPLRNRIQDTRPSTIPTLSMMLLKNRCSTIGVTITPELETVIKGAITGAVESLPKTHDENGNVVKN